MPGGNQHHKPDVSAGVTKRKSALQPDAHEVSRSRSVKKIKSSAALSRAPRSSVGKAPMCQGAVNVRYVLPLVLKKQNLGHLFGTRTHNGIKLVGLTEQRDV